MQKCTCVKTSCGTGSASFLLEGAAFLQNVFTCVPLSVCPLFIVHILKVLKRESDSMIEFLLVSDLEDLRSPDPAWLSYFT